MPRAWHNLVRTSSWPRQSCEAFAERMRERKLTFGDRVHCPFLRPFFLHDRRSADVVAAAETIAALGERSPRPRWSRRRSSTQLGSARRRSGSFGSIPVTRRPAPPLAPTRSSCPIRFSSPSTTPSRRPGLGYTPAALRAVRRAAGDARGSASGSTRGSTRPIEPLLDALVASYREWGGPRDPPHDRDRRLARGADVERVRDPARRVRRRSACRRSICDPRELDASTAATLVAGGAARSIWSTAAS